MPNDSAASAAPSAVAVADSADALPPPAPRRDDCNARQVLSRQNLPDVALAEPNLPDVALAESKPSRRCTGRWPSRRPPPKPPPPRSRQRRRHRRLREPAVSQHPPAGHTLNACPKQRFHALFGVAAAWQPPKGRGIFNSLGGMMLDSVDSDGVRDRRLLQGNHLASLHPTLQPPGATDKMCPGTPPGSSRKNGSGPHSKLAPANSSCAAKGAYPPSSVGFCPSAARLR